MELIERCKAGDPAAVRALLEAHLDAVYRWAVLLGLDRRAAEDATQEVLATAARRVHRCASAAAAPAWLFGITRRVVANARRTAWIRRIVTVARPPEPAFLHRDEDAVERELAVRRTLAKLPSRQVELLVLADVEGHTREELAARLRIPAGTVASRLRLAREAFRRAWDEGEEVGAPDLSWEER